jgi:hypothetical protein
MPINPDKKSAITFFISKETKKKLQSIAKKQNRTLSNFLINELEQIVFLHEKTENTDLSQNDTFSTD